MMLPIRYKQLSPVEADIVLYFVWREIIGEETWFTAGAIGLANTIGRGEKSVREAIKTLQVKGLVQKEKNSNKLWIKHTLTDEELYTRMAFIDPSFCNVLSLQEHRLDLQKYIEWLEEELEKMKLCNVKNYKQNEKIKAVLKLISEEDIEELINSFYRRTNTNSNNSHEEIVEKALQTFREEMFEKYSDELIIDEGAVKEKNFFVDFWKTKTNED